MSSTQPSRRATIERAITVLDNTGHSALLGYLEQTALHRSFREDPERLRSALNDGLQDDLFASFKAAQQLLRAAGEDIR
jgi:hypothetical protein